MGQAPGIGDKTAFRERFAVSLRKRTPKPVARMTAAVGLFCGPGNWRSQFGWWMSGAGERIRTLDPNLGKVASPGVISPFAEEYDRRGPDCHAHALLTPCWMRSPGSRRALAAAVRPMIADGHDSSPAFAGILGITRRRRSNLDARHKLDRVHRAVHRSRQAMPSNALPTR